MTTSAEYLKSAFRYEAALESNLIEIASLAKQGAPVAYLIEQSREFLSQSARLRMLAAVSLAAEKVNELSYSSGTVAQAMNAIDRASEHLGVAS
jgi:hypothetical protein